MPEEAKPRAGRVEVTGHTTGTRTSRPAVCLLHRWRSYRHIHTYPRTLLSASLLLVPFFSKHNIHVQRHAESTIASPPCFKSESKRSASPGSPKIRIKSFPSSRPLVPKIYQ